MCRCIVALAIGTVVEPCNQRQRADSKQLPLGNIVGKLGWRLFGRPLYCGIPRSAGFRPRLATGAHHRIFGRIDNLSTFSAEVVNMLQQGRLLLALSTAALHVVGSLLLTWMGLKTGAWVLH